MSKLVAVAYRVTSDRIRDTEIPAGMTVREFVSLLAAQKLDVVNAHVRIIRRDEDDVLIGRVGDYVLKEGDAVELATNEVDMPVLERRLVAMREAARKDAEARLAKEQHGAGVFSGVDGGDMVAKPACPCGGCDSRIDISTEKVDNGMVIHITVHKG